MNKIWSFPGKDLQSDGGNIPVNFLKIIAIKKKIFGTIVEKALHLSVEDQQIFPRRQSEKGQETS